MMKFSHILLVGALVVSIIYQQNIVAASGSPIEKPGGYIEQMWMSDTRWKTFTNLLEQWPNKMGDATVVSAEKSIGKFEGSMMHVVKEFVEKFTTIIPYGANYASEFAFNTAKVVPFYGLGLWFLSTAKGEFQEAFNRWRKLDPDDEKDPKQKRTWNLIKQNLKWGIASLGAGTFLFYFGKDLAAWLLNYKYNFNLPAPVHKPAKDTTIYELFNPDLWIPKHCKIELPKAA